MNTDNIPTPLIQKVVPFLPLVEKILLTSLLVGIVLVNMQIDSTVAIASLFGLAVTFNHIVRVCGPRKSVNVDFLVLVCDFLHPGP